MKASITKRLMTRIAAGAFVFYAFSGVSSLLNYAFYPVVARFVSVGEYGEIQFLVAMFTQLAVGFVVLNILAIIIGAEVRDTDDQAKAISSLNLVAGLITTCITVIGASILLAQKTSLGLTSPFAIIALGLSLLINVPFTVAIGKLQGNDRFIASGIVSMLGAFFKLIFSLLFIIMGYGVAGAIFGIFVGMAVSLLIVDILNSLKKERRNLPHFTLPARHHLMRLDFIKNRATVALIAVTIITLLSAADSITSRIILSHTEAGQYAAVATVAKMILAATSPLMWLALPPALTHNKKLVLKYCTITLFAGCVATLTFCIFPLFFTATVIGVSAKSYIHFLPLAAVSMTLCAVAFIITTTSICIGSLRSTLITSAVASAAFFGALLIIAPVTNLLTAALYGQAAAALCFIVSLTPKLLRLKPLT